MLLETVQRELKRCGVSRYEIAKQCNIDQTVLFRVFHGGSCSVATLDKLCQFLRLELKSKNRKAGR